jgi:hypothetical protein
MTGYLDLTSTEFLLGMLAGVVVTAAIFIGTQLATERAS